MEKRKDYFTGYNRNLTYTAKELRRKMTKQEKHLWYDFLSHYPTRFYRQRPIDRFIVDFFCFDARLAVEIDGSQHYTEDGLIKDSERTNIIESYQVEVIRFTNIDIDTNFNSVCQTIDAKVKENIKKICKEKAFLKNI